MAEFIGCLVFMEIFGIFLIFNFKIYFSINIYFFEFLFQMNLLNLYYFCYQNKIIKKKINKNKKKF